MSGLAKSKAIHTEAQQTPAIRLSHGKANTLGVTREAERKEMMV